MSKAHAASQAERRQFWQMVLETWQVSGLSVRQFCQNEGLTQGTFYYWRRKLSASCENPRASDPVGASEEFVDVTSLIQSPTVLDLALRSGHTLRMTTATDPHFLSQVLQVLQQVGLC